MSCLKPIGSQILIMFVLLFALTRTANANELSDSKIINGFNLTVFGAEFSPFGTQSKYIKKYSKPVRFKIHDLASRKRSASVQRFILSLNKSISGLKTEIAGPTQRAQFNVYIVDRKDYVKTARAIIYKNKKAAIPGRCIVRNIFTLAGILRSDAIIVSDEGEALFKRCMAEEILQGLGPLNEHSSLSASMFNDKTRHTNFTKFDRYIMNMLYDKRILNGSSVNRVQKVLPIILKELRAKIR